MPDTYWPTLTTIGKTDGGTTVAQARVEVGASWFDGHFPEGPVLPGIAQLAMVFDAVQRSGAGKLDIRGFRRVRFRQVIRPDDELDITVKPHDKRADMYVFDIRIDGEPACKGTIIATPAGRTTSDGSIN